VSNPTENTIFQESLVRITNQRALIGTAAYSFAEIESVRIARQERSRRPLSLVIVSIPLMLWSFVDQTGQFFQLFTLGVFLLVFGLAIFILNKPYYVLQIRGGSKVRNVLSSTDPRFLQRIVEAINKSVVFK